MDSLIYALLAIDDISLHSAFIYMPPDEGIIRCKPIIRDKLL